VAAARELPQLSLPDALELTLLCARKDPRRFQRVAARWLQRYLDEHPETTIDEAAMVVASLAALIGDRHTEAAGMLRSLAAQSGPNSRSAQRGQ
jgi:hypothetical protein